MEFDVEMLGSPEPFDVELIGDFRIQQEIHNRLVNRDAANAHPISSITGLRAELNAIWAEAEVVEDEEVEEAFADAFEAVFGEGSWITEEEEDDG